jgi:hypothetical protein
VGISRCQFYKISNRGHIRFAVKKRTLRDLTIRSAIRPHKIVPVHLVRSELVTDNHDKLKQQIFFCQKIQGELGKFTRYSPTTILGTECKESFYQPRKQRVDQTLDPQYEMKQMD